MDTLAWRRYAGKHVVVYVIPNSSAEKDAPRVLQQAERIVQALEKLFPPLHHAPDSPIPIYLIDQALTALWMGELSAQNKIVRVVQPDAPVESLTLAIARLVITRWFGEGAASLAIILDGLAG